MSPTRVFLLVLLLLVLPVAAAAQASSSTARRFIQSTSLPATCAKGDVYFQGSDSTFYGCTATNTWTSLGGAGGSGTVTSVSVVTANGFSGSVANATTTPAITINNPTALVATTSITDNGLTSGRVTFAGTAGLLSDDADLTFATDTLTATKIIGSTSMATPLLTLGTASSVTGALKLANSASAHLTTIQAGNADAARTYTWPRDFGAAGTVLTDAAGNGTLSWAAGGGGLTVGTTTIASGTTTKVLFDNAGVLGEYTVTGSTNVVMSASPTLTGTVAMAAMTASGTIVQTSNSATAFESGPNGSTNPVFRLVNSVGSQATGLSITGNASGSGVTLTALGGTNENIILTPKGTGNVALTGSANASLLTSTTYSLTGSNASNGIDLSGTWNTSGTPTFLKIAITNTAVGSSGKYVELLGGSTGAKSLWSISQGGTHAFNTDGAIASTLATFGFAGSAASWTISSSSILGTSGSKVQPTTVDFLPGGDTILSRLTPGVIGLVAASSAGGTFGSTATSPSQITSDQNNYNPGGSSHLQRWNTDASRNITGLTFTATQVAGQEHLICNVGSQNIVLVHDDGSSSTAANRFKFAGGTNVTIAADDCVLLTYDATTARWRRAQ